MQVSLWFAGLIYFRYLPRSRVAGSHGRLNSSFLINIYTALHNNCVGSCSHDVWTHPPVSPWLDSRFHFCLFDDTTLTSEQRHLIVLLICISPKNTITIAHYQTGVFVVVVGGGEFEFFMYCEYQSCMKWQIINVVLHFLSFLQALLDGWMFPLLLGSTFSADTFVGFISPGVWDIIKTRHYLE